MFRSSMMMRGFATKSTIANTKLIAPPMVYIMGEEHTRYAGELYLNEWIKPYVDTSKWEFYDLSCKARDDTNDQVLRDAISAGKRLGSIYKEPTITPTAEQAKEMGLKKVWGSPNGAMRKGWNGVSISRDTIHLPGMQMGYKNKCLFDRHAVGGEYGASWKMVGPGTVSFTFTDNNNSVTTVDSRKLTDTLSGIVCYDNPLDNVTAMSHHFFTRCLEAKVTPYITTKKTVFKWQESFWVIMKKVFDENYKEKFNNAGLLKKTNGELTHFLSDVASMHLVRWSEGGWGLCAHNYDGDVLTDLMAQVHRSPGFLTSVLNGVNEDGSIIKEFEASHGTVTDMHKARLKGEETSLNPLSMMEALLGAMEHSAILAGKEGKTDVEYINFVKKLQNAIHTQMTTPGKGTRDLSGPKGLTTEGFVKAVRDRIDGKVKKASAATDAPLVVRDPYEIDDKKMKALFKDLDTDGNGTIDYKEFALGMKRLGMAPMKLK